MINQSFLDISLNSDSSFNSSFEPSQNVSETSRLNEKEKNHSTEENPQSSDSELLDVSISSDNSVICCISPSKQDSHSNVSSMEGNNSKYMIMTESHFFRYQIT